jgi:predicted CXXCH cytochrome family protein
MTKIGLVKWAIVASWITTAVLLTVPESLSNTGAPADDTSPAAVSTSDNPSDNYVGSETCSTCHDEVFKSFAKTTHSHLQKAGWKSERVGCESCHGPGKAHVDGGGDKTKIRTFEAETPKQISETCLACHAGREEHNNYRRGEHWRNDIACTDCHSPHSSSRVPVLLKGDGSSSLQPVGPFAAHASNFEPVRLLKKHEAQLCMTCHNETKSQFNRPFHHKVLEGAMKCSDCHNPHGGFELKQARLSTGADAACFKCHADKQGPFVFEHAPLKIEGCAACHDPHGSANPRLLKRSNVAQLCIECHSEIGTKVGEIPEPGAPSTPSFHNLSTPRFQNCTTCHAKIHGSNVNKDFFR